MDITILIILILIGIATFLQRSRNKYREIAYRDDLTGAYSRVFLDKWLRRHGSKGNKKEYTSSVIIIDVDNFKYINDIYGHTLGDKILIKIVSAFKSSIRKNDLIVRFGGDEFLLILDKCDEECAYTIMHRALDTLRKENQFTVDVEMSYGVAEVTNNEDFYRAVELADKKMYIYKNQKKGTYPTFGVEYLKEM
ncbi:MAG: GGDEF domain-containing protein [Clostridiaceae bacterium]|nr:GGDEF domain-containing protein [Clostridiaceae bacterium]